MPKKYSPIQVKAHTLFPRKIIHICQVVFINHCLNFLLHIIHIFQVIPMILSSNPIKGPYFIPSAYYPYIPSLLCSPLFKFSSSAYPDIPSQINSSLPKNYLSIQVSFPTWFHQHIIQICQVIFICRWLNLLRGSFRYAKSDLSVISDIGALLPKFPSADHSDIPSHLYLSLPKHYPSIQVMANTSFFQNLIPIYYVSFINHWLNFLQKIIQICQVVPMILSFNPSTGPHFIPSAYHSDIPSQMFSSFIIFPSGSHSYMPSQSYSKFPKQYPSIQVKSRTWFLQKIIQTCQVIFNHHCLIFLQHLIQILQVRFIHHFLLISFNPSKGSYLIPSEDHSDISGQLY